VAVDGGLPWESWVICYIGSWVSTC
jgi:hypothetical protein